MEVLVLDGKNYVKASKAARDLGYASDYVGQLCRSGQVDAHLIGRTWYVNQEELGTHRFEKKRMSRVKAREQAKKTIEEHRLKVTSGARNNYKNIDIRYESDDEELIPETRKIEVQSTDVREVREEPKYDSTTEIINKGERVRMSGDLKVVDVTDGPIETDTTILRPGRIRSGTITVSPREEEHIEEVAVLEEEDVKLTPVSFTERLEALQNTTEEPEDALSESMAPETLQAEEEVGSITLYVVTTVMVLLLVLLTLPVSKTVVHTPSSQEVLISYEFSLSKIISIISLKI